MLEHIIIEIICQKYKQKNKRNALFKRVIHQTFWLIGCSQK